MNKIKSLLLTSYYLVYRSFFTYLGIALVVSGILFFFGGPSTHSIIAMLVILLTTTPATEVLKHEAKSGYDKFVLTLPINRIHVVQNHYLFYIIIATVSSLLAPLLLYAYGLISGTSINDVTKFISFGIFIILFAGALAYPLIYVFGPEKSDSLIIGSGMIGMFLSLGLHRVTSNLAISLSTSEAEADLYVRIIYILLGVIIFILSFFISVFIYRKKEF